MGTWNLRRHRIACATCESTFADRDRYFSVLTTQGGELARTDFCQGCWLARPGAPADLFWWRSRQAERNRRGMAFNLEALEALFIALEGRNDLRVQELRYLLCLLLMRKRRLKIVRMTREGGADAFVVRRPRRQEEFVVIAHDFTAQRMDDLRVELRSLFADGVAPVEFAAGLSRDVGSTILEVP